MPDANEPRDHHYAPQFFLRNFATDDAKLRINTVSKSGQMAVWKERSIESLGYERDLYVHTIEGVPYFVETDINRRVETPISQSDTWKKIVSGQTAALDQSDRPVLYALMRHLEARTPHYRATMAELTEMAGDPGSEIPFTTEERAMYGSMRADPEFAKSVLNQMAASTSWTERQFKGCALSILRSPIPLRSSTTPAFPLPAPAHPAMSLPLPGMAPYQLALTLNPTTVALLVLGEFDGLFSNNAVDAAFARGLNRSFACQFAKFDHVRHLVANRDETLVEDMIWAPYDLLKATPNKVVFRRRLGE